MPRAATSVAIRVATSPRSNEARARSRWRWLLSPCIASAVSPCARRRLTSRSAPRLVRTKTRVLVPSALCSCSTRWSSLALCESTLRKRCSISALATPSAAWVWRRASRVYSAGRLAGSALERRREEQRLAARGGLGDDPLDGGSEAHVEHPVGLVEDEHGDVTERDDAAAEQVLEPAGGGDQEVGAARGLDLRAEADAAVDGGDAERPRLGERAQFVDDLADQLPGRGEDEAERLIGPGGDPLDQRDPEGKGLARTGRGLDEKVVAGERVADDELLYGEGLGDVAASKRAHHLFRGAEIGK